MDPDCLAVDPVPGGAGTPPPASNSSQANRDNASACAVDPRDLEKRPAARATLGLRYGGGMPTLIFVHGAVVRDAPWWWSKMTEPLAERGIATAVVALPSCGEAGERLGDLYDDVDACRRAIAEDCRCERAPLTGLARR